MRGGQQSAYRTLANKNRAVGVQSERHKTPLDSSSPHSSDGLGRWVEVGGGEEPQTGNRAPGTETRRPGELQT